MAVSNGWNISNSTTPRLNMSTWKEDRWYGGRQPDYRHVIEGAIARQSDRAVCSVHEPNARINMSICKEGRQGGVRVEILRVAGGSGSRSSQGSLD